MTTVSNLPLSGLSGFGTIKATGLQLHTIRQVSTINAPNLTGDNGDLILDSGSSSRSGNGHLKIKGGVEGSGKIDVLETGVWDKNLDIGRLTNSNITAESLEDHLSIGTLLTGLKIPILGSGSMDNTKVYALRNVGTSGHVAWASINDIGGDLKMSGALSVSSNTFLSQDLSVGGKSTIDGNVLMAQMLSVGGNINTNSSLSVGGRIDLESQMVVGGITVLNSSLSVATTGVFGDTLSVASNFTSESAVIETTLSVGDFAQFASHVSVASDISLNDLHVRGRVFPFSNGLSIGGNVILADNLSVSGAVYLADQLVIDGNASFSGSNFTLHGSDTINIGGTDTHISVSADQFQAATPFKLMGHLSVGNSSAILFDTPLLSVQGSIFTQSDATFRGKMALANDLSCGASAFLGNGLTVGTHANIGASLAVGSDLSVNGAVTINGSLIVEGTTTSISSTVLTVQDKTLELGVVDDASDILAIGSGLIIKGTSDKKITYTRSATTSATTQQLSAFQLSEDLVLDKKITAFESSLNSKLVTNPRSQVLHLGDMSSTDGHWMIVSDIVQGKLQFWYGQDIADDQTMDAMPDTVAKLAFEIQKPT